MAYGAAGAEAVRKVKEYCLVMIESGGSSGATERFCLMRGHMARH